MVVVGARAVVVGDSYDLAVLMRGKYQRGMGWS